MSKDRTSVVPSSNFSVSLLGGHPHNWTAISKECLNLLSDLTQKLIMQQEAAATNGRVKQPFTGEIGRSLNSTGIFV